MENSVKKVMVFGVFDIIHDGHRHFLTSAKSYGNKLVAVVATDSSVKSLKNALPYNPLKTRIENLDSEKLVDTIISGDSELSSWQVIEKEKPDIIALGYDQINLKNHLEKFITENKLEISLVTIPPLHDGEMHSSVLRKKIV